MDHAEESADRTKEPADHVEQQSAARAEELVDPVEESADRAAEAADRAEEPAAGPEGVGTGRVSVSVPVPDWTDPAAVLAAATRVLGAPLGETLGRLSAELGALVPHRAAAELSGYCAHSPLKTAGDRELAARVTGSELGRLAATVPVDRPWQGAAQLAGEARRVLAVASREAGGAGALLVLAEVSGQPVPAPVLRLVQRLWDLVTARELRRALAPEPAQLGRSRAAASERGRVTAELAAAHSATLTGLLTTLRAPALGDGQARAAATELALSALLALRSYAEWDRGLSEESLAEAFARSAAELRPLLRFGSVRLELRAPEPDRTVPSDLAHTAGAATRATVLAMLEQDGVRRLRLRWHTAADRLRVVVRDDGPGTLDADSLGAHRVGELLDALGGTLTVDAEPGWGTTVTAALPLGPLTAPAPGPLAELHPRELEVLGLLTRGLRNRAIAAELHISESTVKFHVANILGKLGAASRGEAAALAREAGVQGP
ncbi:LuxR C-terminal-related transcriptional regulator [Streptomyces physcomitrii]|uniref:HTH luxR-type domain-containing protein n=1 Tax=Streptomyces physcomitrii TaxID=2724184 RepID=A0ABX1H2V7_9ACTN|nr:LuxR C-terminal-related transcriptional regulator [Streptomyces physcomitrii]NKI41371.1 hypothetical protein [Streptomyces physcomitrii]